MCFTITKAAVRTYVSLLLVFEEKKGRARQCCASKTMFGREQLFLKTVVWTYMFLVSVCEKLTTHKTMFGVSSCF
jgi:hypothetical protein